MKKMKTLFKKDPNDLSRVTSELDESCMWVFEEGVETSQKLDGTACAIISGKLYKRWDNKKGNEIPIGAIECQEADKITGHHPYWVLCDRSNPSDKWHFLAYDSQENLDDGTYELIGEAINKNREKIEGVKLEKHGERKYDTSEVLKNVISFLDERDIEGVVFKHPDGRMCKIRKRDFGLKR